jgi:excisionase family DNA binding protein
MALPRAVLALLRVLGAGMAGGIPPAQTLDTGIQLVAPLVVDDVPLLPLGAQATDDVEVPDTTPEAQPPLDKAIYTAEEVARLLGCSPKAVYAKVSRGQLPGAFRVGRSLRFRGSELLPFILEGRVLSPRRSRR